MVQLFHRKEKSELAKTVRTQADVEKFMAKYGAVLPKSSNISSSAVVADLCRRSRAMDSRGSGIGASSPRPLSFHAPSSNSNSSIEKEKKRFRLFRRRSSLPVSEQDSHDAMPINSNPFSDAESTGETPTMPWVAEMSHETMRVQNISAERKPRIHEGLVRAKSSKARSETSYDNGDPRAGTRWAGSVNQGYRYPRFEDFEHLFPRS